MEPKVIFCCQLQLGFHKDRCWTGLGMEDKGTPHAWVALLDPWGQGLQHEFQVIHSVMSTWPPLVHIIWPGPQRVTLLLKVHLCSPYGLS